MTSTQTDATLDPGLIECMLRASLEPAQSAADDALLARVRESVVALAHERALGPATRTIGLQQGQWQELWQGVRAKLLLEIGSDVSVLLSMEEGAQLPAHGHRASEHCVVVSGRVKLGPGTELGAGGFHWVDAGVKHDTITALEPTVLYLRGELDLFA